MIFFNCARNNTLWARGQSIRRIFPEICSWVPGHNLVWTVWQPKGVVATQVLVSMSFRPNPPAPNLHLGRKRMAAIASKIPLIAYYPLSCWEIPSGLKCVALPHLSNRGIIGKITLCLKVVYGSECGKISTAQWKRKFPRRFTPNYPNRIVVHISIWTECLNSWRDSQWIAIFKLKPASWYSRWSAITKQSGVSYYKFTGV